MRALLLCLVAVAVPASLGAVSNNKFYATFSMPWQDPDRKASFFELPRKTPNSDGWALDEDCRSTVGVAVYCRNKDYRLCLLFDKKDSIAGIQFSIAVADLKNSWNAPVHKALKQKTVAGTSVYSTTVYFVDDNVLKAGGRVLEANTPTAPNGYLLPSGTGAVRRMPLKESEMATAANFTRQRCISGMGRHYFNVNKKMKCEDSDSFFGLYNEQTQELVGGGFTAFGVASAPKNDRIWLESPPRIIIKYISPDSPWCAVYLGLKHGLTTLHFYFTDEPWNLKC